MTNVPSNDVADPDGMSTSDDYRGEADLEHPINLAKDVVTTVGTSTSIHCREESDLEDPINLTKNVFMSTLPTPDEVSKGEESSKPALAENQFPPETHLVPTNVAHTELSSIYEVSRLIRECPIPPLTSTTRRPRRPKVAEEAMGKDETYGPPQVEAVANAMSADRTKGESTEPMPKEAMAIDVMNHASHVNLSQEAIAQKQTCESRAMDVTTESLPANLAQEGLAKERMRAQLPVNVTEKAMRKDMRKDVAEDAMKMNVAKEGTSEAPAARVTKKGMEKDTTKEAPPVKVAWDVVAKDVTKEAAHSNRMRTKRGGGTESLEAKNIIVAFLPRQAKRSKGEQGKGAVKTLVVPSPMQILPLSEEVTKAEFRKFEE